MERSPTLVWNTTRPLVLGSFWYTDMVAAGLCGFVSFSGNKFNTYPALPCPLLLSIRRPPAWSSFERGQFAEEETREIKTETLPTNSHARQSRSPQDDTIRPTQDNTARERRRPICLTEFEVRKLHGRSPWPSRPERATLRSNSLRLAAAVPLGNFPLGVQRRVCCPAGPTCEPKYVRTSSQSWTTLLYRSKGHPLKLDRTLSQPPSTGPETLDWMVF